MDRGKSIHEVTNEAVGRVIARTERDIVRAYSEMIQRVMKKLSLVNRGFVKGIRVSLFNNHTCNGVPFRDICDDLQGVYPGGQVHGLASSVQMCRHPDSGGLRGVSQA